MLSPRSRWLWPAGLALVSVIPVGAGLVRLADLIGPTTAENARFHAQAVASALHVGGGALYLALGPWQVMRWPGHRPLGRVATAAGLAAALSGLWMTATFPVAPNNDPVIMALRLIFGVAWAGCLALGLAAVLQGQIARHRAFMLRGYAIGLGAGTTVLTLGLWYAITGQATPLASALAQLAAWVLNLWVVERFLITPTHRGSR